MFAGVAARDESTLRKTSKPSFHLSFLNSRFVHCVTRAECTSRQWQMRNGESYSAWSRLKRICRLRMPVLVKIMSPKRTRSWRFYTSFSSLPIGAKDLLS